jgi:hypothetical protein
MTSLKLDLKQFFSEIFPLNSPSSIALKTAGFMVAAGAGFKLVQRSKDNENNYISNALTYMNQKITKIQNTLTGYLTQGDVDKQATIISTPKRSDLARVAKEKIIQNKNKTELLKKELDTLSREVDEHCAKLGTEQDTDSGEKFRALSTFKNNIEDLLNDISQKSPLTQSDLEEKYEKYEEIETELKKIFQGIIEKPKGTDASDQTFVQKAYQKLVDILAWIKEKLASLGQALGISSAFNRGKKLMFSSNTTRCQDTNDAKPTL